MIIGFCAMFILFGTMFMMSQYYMPPIGELIVSLQMMGLCFIAIGVIVMAARSNQTGAGMIMDLPSVDHSISIHSDIANKRLDPNAKLMKLKNIGLGMYKGKKMVFKNTGGGMRIAGHNVIRTHEKLAADLPEWLGQYLYQIREKYMVKNDEELLRLYKQLMNIEHNKDIEDIKELEPVLKDEKRKLELLTMPLDELQKMQETLFDGETVHMEDVERFIKLTSPQELDTWIDQEVNKEEREKKRYRDPGTHIDWNRYVMPLGILFILGVLGTVILLSYIGK